MGSHKMYARRILYYVIATDPVASRGQIFFSQTMTCLEHSGVPRRGFFLIKNVVHVVINVCIQKIYTLIMFITSTTFFNKKNLFPESCRFSEWLINARVYKKNDWKRSFCVLCSGEAHEKLLFHVCIGNIDNAKNPKKGYRTSIINHFSYFFLSWIYF